MRRRHVLPLMLITIAGIMPSAAVAAPSQTVNAKEAALPPAAAEAAERMIAKGTSGVTIVFGDSRGEILRADVGNVAADTRYPIASASKWLTAATVMALVDEGKLSLDSPVSTWLPDEKGETGKLTLRLLLSQTSGLSGSLSEMYDVRQDHRITLAQSAAEILARPLVTTPGSAFVYGGPGFQVVGAVVEAATGQSWEEVFQSRIARPLDMKNTHWTHLKFGGETPPASETRNPVLQGGAVGPADDYARFLSMLSQKGRLGGRQVLSEQSISQMQADRTSAAVMNPTGAALLENAHYSLGSWCETWDDRGQCTRNSSIGAFGTYPWLDSPSGRYGIIFINRHEDAFAVWPELMAIQAALTKAF